MGITERYRANKKANGICVECRQPIAPNSSIRCVYHMSRAKELSELRPKRNRKPKVKP